MCTVQAHAQGILQMVVDPSFGNGLLLATGLLSSHLVHPPNCPISKYGFMGKCSTDYLVSVMSAR